MFDYIYHEHFSYFSAIFMNNYLKKFNFFLFDAIITDPKGGSIKFFIKKNNSRKLKQSTNLQNIIHLENRNKINSIEYFKNFNIRINKFKKILNNNLIEIFNNNKIIVGIGASHSTTTLIYHYNISQYIHYLVDDNNIKHGTFAPGNKIPVYSTKKIYDNPPDYLLILGWQHQDTIINKHKKLLKKGCKFIIPLPKFKIITK